MPQRLVLASPRQSSRRAPTRGCSCDELLRVANTPAGKAVLAEFAVDEASLLAARKAVHGDDPDEPADWHVRLRQRGAGPGEPSEPLATLLAIVRSADSHAYRLLEHSGASCARLRKALIERIRAKGAESVRGHTAEPLRRSMGVADRAGISSDHAGQSAVHCTQGSELRGGVAPSGSDLASVRERLRARAERRGDESQPVAPNRGRRPSPRDATDSMPASDRSPGGSIRPVSPTAACRRPIATRPEDTESESPLAVVNRDRTATDASARGDEAAGSGSPVIETESAASLLVVFESSGPCELAGRESTLARLADALTRVHPRPVLIVGESGSGRTAIAGELARRLARPVERLDATECEDEERLAASLSDARTRNVIVVLDDLDRVPQDSCPPWLGSIAHAWATSAPLLVTIVSPEGRSRLESWIPNVSELFDIIELTNLDAEAALRAVQRHGEHLLRVRRLTLAPDASFTELEHECRRWLSGLAMPARAIDVFDLACSRAARDGRTVVAADDWRAVIAERSGLSIARIAGRSETTALHLEAALAERIVGHQHALSTIAELFRRGRAGFRGHRPLVSALLAGPSGVGKTELAKSLAAVLFDSSDALVRLDMSEYAEAHAVARIVGAPPGYVGYERGGVLTDALLRRPHCVVLLDEIEKAHRDVHQLLLQVLDEGWLTDGRGRQVSFAHCVLVMTSNLGATQLVQTPEVDDAAVLSTVAAAFPPELWNRIEAPLVLRALTRDELVDVCRRLAEASSRMLETERGISYRLGAGAIDRLVELAGRETGQGARPLRHLLARHVEALLARAVLSRELVRGDEALVTVDGAGEGEFACRVATLSPDRAIA